MGKQDGIEDLNRKFSEKRRLVNFFVEKHEELSKEEKPQRTGGLRRKITALEIELRLIRRNALEYHHAKLPFWMRWNTPKYWEIVCPIKLNYKVCGVFSWYEHISNQWYETEELALEGALKVMKQRKQENNRGYAIGLGPLERVVSTNKQDSLSGERLVSRPKIPVLQGGESIKG